MFVLRLKKKRFIIALTAVLTVITAFLVIINADFTSVEDNDEKNSKQHLAFEMEPTLPASFL